MFRHILNRLVHSIICLKPIKGWQSANLISDLRRPFSLFHFVSVGQVATCYYVSGRNSYKMRRAGTDAVSATLRSPAAIRWLGDFNAEGTSSITPPLNPSLRHYADQSGNMVKWNKHHWKIDLFRGIIYLTPQKIRVLKINALMDKKIKNAYVINLYTEHCWLWHCYTQEFRKQNLLFLKKFYICLQDSLCCICLARPWNIVSKSDNAPQNAVTTGKYSIP